MERLLKETPILDYNHLLIKNLIEQRKWNELGDVDKVKNISLYTTNFTEPLSYQDSAFLKLPKFP